MDLWNVKNLEPPPIITAPADIKEIDIKLLRKTLKDAVDFFENQPHLSTEAAMLSRTIYRMKMKFRSSKDLKSLQMLNRALRIYLYLQIPKVLKSFLDSIPQNYKGKKTHLPTKHMLDFVLVRIQSLGKTLLKIYLHCKRAGILAQLRLRLGHFWKIAIIFYAMSARIFVITKSLIKYTCELYTNLLPFASKLNSSGNHWLPAGYQFPEILSEWLEIDWVDLETTVIEIPDDEPNVLSYFDLIDDSDDDDVQFCDEYVDLSVRDESVIEIIEPTPSGSPNDEIISLCETESLPPKENRITDGFKGFPENVQENSIADGFKGFSEDVDVGEVVQVDDDQALPLKKKAHNQKAGDMDVINLSKVETPPIKHQKKKKNIGFNKKQQPTPKDDNMKEETNSNPDLLNADCSIISLTDSESPLKGKKRKRGSFKNLINPQGDIKHLNTSSKDKKQETDNVAEPNTSSFIDLLDVESPKAKNWKPASSKNKINVQENVCVSFTDSESPPKGKKRKLGSSKNKINHQEDIKHENTSSKAKKQESGLSKSKIEIQEANTSSSIDLLDSEIPRVNSGTCESFRNKIYVQENLFIGFADSESSKQGKKRKRRRSKNKIKQEKIKDPNTSSSNPNMASASTEKPKKTQVSVPTLTKSNKKPKRRGRSKNKIGVQTNDANVTFSERSNPKIPILQDRLRESVRIKQDSYKIKNYKIMNKTGKSTVIEEHIQSIKKKRRRKKKKGSAPNSIKNQLPIL